MKEIDIPGLSQSGIIAPIVANNVSQRVRLEQRKSRITKYRPPVILQTTRHHVAINGDKTTYINYTNRECVVSPHHELLNHGGEAPLDVHLLSRCIE
jgi:hypothetical protein